MHKSRKCSSAIIFLFLALTVLLVTFLETFAALASHGLVSTCNLRVTMDLLSGTLLEWIAYLGIPLHIVPAAYPEKHETRC